MTLGREMLGEDLHYLEMKCAMRKCGEPVVDTNDYKAHLTEAHGVTSNLRLTTLLKQFEDKMKEERGGLKRKPEVIDLTDDEEEESEDENMEEVSESDNIKLEEVLKRAMGNTLKPLHDILEDHSDILKVNERTGAMNEVTPDREFPEEEFQSLKNKLQNIKIPREMLNPLISGVDPEPPVMTPLPSKPPPPDSDSPRSNKSSGSTRQRRVSSASTASSASSASSTSSTRVVVFLCPLPDCSFTTDKEGMRKRSAAIHISKTHGVTNKMMKNSHSGTYTFKKVKREI